MTTKKIVEGGQEIRRSVGSLRKLLSDDPNGKAQKIRFKRYGRRYVITNKDNDLQKKLEQSFNTFMNKLEVKKDGKELRGVCFLGNTDEFNICYQIDHQTTLHQIKGKVGL